MAVFCTKCGATLSGDTAFCTKCGAPVAATAPTPAASTPQAYSPQPYVPPASNPPMTSTYAQPVAVGAPVKGGPSALKIILIILAVFVGLGIIGAAVVGFGIYRISKAVHVSNAGGGSVEVSTPGGTISAGTVSVNSSDLGVDLYPGATQQQGAVRFSTPNGTAITATYVTSDPMDKVVDFYKEKLGASASVFQSDKSAVLSMNSDDKKNSVMVTISADTPGQTKIGILHSKSS